MHLFDLFVDDFSFDSFGLYNFVEGKDNYYYYIPIKEKPNIYVQGTVLTIETKNNKFTITLPKFVSDNIKCDYEDEVLKIAIQKQKVKKIDF